MSLTSQYTVDHRLRFFLPMKRHISSGRSVHRSVMSYTGVQHDRLSRRECGVSESLCAAGPPFLQNPGAHIGNLEGLFKECFKLEAGRR